MNKVLYIILISLFSFTVISCSEDKEESTTDTTAPVIAEVTAVTTPTNDIHISLIKYFSKLLPPKY